MTTIYEVSELAGVSLATVSRVMNRSGKVADKTREKVERAMKELGYRPNSIAQSLASNRSNSVGVVLPIFYGPFYGDLLAGIEEELRESDKQMVITAGYASKEQEESAIEFLLSRNCDALILRVDSVSDDYLVELSRGAVPVVVQDRHIPEIAESCIYIDNELGGYMATRSVLELGHRDIAYISGPMWKQDAQGRLAGHRRALQEFNVEYQAMLTVEGNFQDTGGRQGMEQLLSSGYPFTVVVCANDEMAAGAFGVARERNMRIPEEISFMGFDNVFFTEYFRPKLSTVNFPVKEMGRMAARLILKQVYGQDDQSIQNRFEPELVMRNSVHCIGGI